MKSVPGEKQLAGVAFVVDCTHALKEFGILDFETVVCRHLLYWSWVKLTGLT
jgi:hypothetical protein